MCVQMCLATGKALGRGSETQNIPSHLYSQQQTWENQKLWLTCNSIQWRGLQFFCNLIVPAIVIVQLFSRFADSHANINQSSHHLGMISYHISEPRLCFVDWRKVHVVWMTLIHLRAQIRE